jgi:hypothetical protein
MNLIDEKTALIELTDAELYEVAGGNFVLTIYNRESNQGVQVSGIQGGVNFGHWPFKSVRHFW